jgi:hypothetical protein
MFIPRLQSFGNYLDIFSHFPRVKPFFLKILKMFWRALNILFGFFYPNISLDFFSKYLKTRFFCGLQILSNMHVPSHGAYIGPWCVYRGDAGVWSSQPAPDGMLVASIA